MQKRRIHAKGHPSGVFYYEFFQKRKGGSVRFEKEVSIFTKNAILKRFQANETNFSIVQGKISAIISEDEITELQSGRVTMYSKLGEVEQTASGVSSKFSEFKTDYDKAQEEYKKFKTNTSEYIQTAGRFQSTVESYMGTNDEKVNNIKTTASQTAEKFTWLVESGESSTNFILTDRVTELITESLVIKNKDGKKTIISGGRMDIDEIFAQDITASGSITGATLKGGKISGSDIVANTMTANESYSIYNGNSSQKILYFDGTSIKLGKMGTGTSIQSGAGFEFFDKTITMYGSLSLYSGDITTPGKVQGKTITATADINTDTIYASNWFRSRGNTGWYSEDYGGGWYMADSDWIRAYNGKGITTTGNMSIGGFIQSNNIINTTYEYQSNRGSVDWRFGAATGTGDENFFGFFDANNRIIPLAIDGNFGNIYVGFNVGGSGSKTAVGIYLGAQVAGNRAFIYHGDSYAGSIWIQTRLDGSWKWFSLGRVCSTALSDIRLKDNLRETEVKNATKVIESMKIHSFERKDSHKKYKIGFIADELEQLDPNLVDGGGEVDGHPYYKSVNNLQMLAYVVKSMQELNQRVSELEKENEKLKRKLNLN